MRVMGKLLHSVLMRTLILTKMMMDNFGQMINISNFFKVMVSNLKVLGNKVEGSIGSQVV